MLPLFLAISVATLVSILFLAKYPSSEGRSPVLQRAVWYVAMAFFAFTAMIFGTNYGAPADHVSVVVYSFGGISIVIAVWHAQKAIQNLVAHMVRVAKQKAEEKRVAEERSSARHHRTAASSPVPATAVASAPAPKPATSPDVAAQTAQPASRLKATPLRPRPRRPSQPIH